MVNMKNKDLPTTTSKSAKAVKPRQANALGKTSYSQIVDTAERVLAQDGYHGLSTRKVADLCGISVGNLTYHFPNKMLLIKAVMTSVCDRYDRNRAAIWLHQDNLNPQDYIRNLVSWMVEDAVTQETSALFLELWVLAKHHEFGSEILERFYATANAFLSGG
jgi:AcrR family transcriptional regulator